MRPLHCKSKKGTYSLTVRSLSYIVSLSRGLLAETLPEIQQNKQDNPNYINKVPI